ncbi:hypothetical protein [Pseudoalteromonas luteoviolacea]|uniref:DUF4157 domain-containing protein n=1 Tax=Pseudoalteromonas luteoviolacea DSM 6061 TaxID=1365250 RepID=A0A166UGA2_9GAMM|nr:hypothetical protein [Pseudoalteromonas luteoviolacea]KZN30631.1 hypothetical protein N475_24700 [Pseudoalteromonas luteoviolacea DSM 6061]MBE0388781.1 hypothetical protein [Pseudoalteromonas luteoviolacea DSM 6061]
MADVNGGNFGHGFWAAGLNRLLGGGGNYTQNPITNVVISAAVGGTISEVTGGKFRNGAYSAAFTSAMRQDWGAAESGKVKKQGKQFTTKSEMEEVKKQNLKNFAQAVDLVNLEYPDLLKGLEIDFANISADGQALSGTNKILISTNVSEGRYRYNLLQLTDLLIHEGLHHRVYNVMGWKEYHLRNFFGGGIHDDIYQIATSAALYATSRPVYRLYNSKPDLSHSYFYSKYDDYF